MARDTQSPLTRLVEARAQIQRAYEAVDNGDRTELVASLTELIADVDELRWVLTENAGQASAHDRRERTESDECPK